MGTGNAHRRDDRHETPLTPIASTARVTDDRQKRFVLAAASRLSWISLDCDVTGTLDRVDRVTQFTHFDMTAHLIVSAGVDADVARHALAKAERNCLISSSLKASITLDATVEMAEPAELQVPA